MKLIMIYQRRQIVLGPEHERVLRVVEAPRLPVLQINILYPLGRNPDTVYDLGDFHVVLYPSFDSAPKGDSQRTS